MSCEEPPQKKTREEGSFQEIMDLVSEITNTELMDDQEGDSVINGKNPVRAKMDRREHQDDILKILEDLVEFTRMNSRKKERDFLNLELSYDESLERVEQCEEMLAEAREALAEKAETEKRLEGKLEEKEGELSRLREKLLERACQLSQKEAELEILKEKMSDLEKDRQPENESSLLREENQQLRLKNESLKEAIKQELSEKDDFILALREKKESEESEKVESLQMELNKERQKLSSSETRFEQLNIVMMGFKEKIVLCDSLDKENARLNQIIRNAEERRQADEVKISTLEENLKNIEKEYRKLSEDSRKHLENLETKLEKVISAVNQRQPGPGNSVSIESSAQDPLSLKKTDTTSTNNIKNRGLIILKKSVESKGPPSTTITRTPSSSSSRLTITPTVQISSASPSASKLLASNTKLHHLINTNSLLISGDVPQSSFDATLEESVPRNKMK